MAARILSAREMEAERQAIAERVKATHGVDYLQSLPAAIPPGTVLLHNRVQPTRRLGSNGFHAWLVAADDDDRHARRVVCDCGWAPELGTHYRVVWTNDAH